MISRRRVLSINHCADQGACDKGLHYLQLGERSGTGNTAMSSCVRSTVTASGKEDLYQCNATLLVISSWVGPVRGGGDFDLDWVLKKAVLQP